MIRCVYLYLFCLTLPLSAFAETLLKINFNNGQASAVYILENLQRLTFDKDGNLVVSSEGVSESYAHKNIRSYTVKGVEDWSFTDDISVIHDLPLYHFENGVLKFDPADFSRKVVIYSMSGYEIMRFIVHPSLYHIHDLNGLQSGAYIVTVNGRAQKLIK